MHRGDTPENKTRKIPRTRDQYVRWAISGKRRFSLEIFALIFSFNFRYGRILWPRYAAARRTSRPPRRPWARSPRAPVLAEIHYLDRPQGDRHPVRNQRPDFSLLRFFPHDADALATRVSRPEHPPDREPSLSHVWPGRGPGRPYDARVLQLVRCDAWHDHDLPRHRPNCVRRLRKFRRAAPDRRARHDLSEDQHGQLPGVLCWRPHHAHQLFRSGRRGQGRLDFLYAPRGPLRQGTGLQSILERPDALARRIYFPDHLVASRRGQFYCDHHPVTRQRDDLDAAPVLRLGAIRDRVSIAARVPAARIGRHHAADGPRRRNKFLSAERPGGERRAAPHQRRRGDASLGGIVLGPRASRGLPAAFS